MSTRHNVIFTSTNEEIKYDKDKQKVDLNNFIGQSPMVYVHSDGYPSGALPILIEFLNTAGGQYRRRDSEYLSAWYITWKIQKHFQKDPATEDDFTGIGIEASPNSWCDYTYIVDGDYIWICKGEGEYLYCFNLKHETLDDIKDKDWYY